MDAPKTRKGDDNELKIGNVQINSVVSKVREIADANRDMKRYLLWFGLDTEEIVYLLFNEGSNDFNLITDIVGNIGGRKIKLGNDTLQFGQLIGFLNNKVETVNFEYYEELEIASQTGGTSSRRRAVPRPRDIEKANELFKKIGHKGEELLSEYLNLQKANSLIKDFTWLNASREVSMPYDFEIINLDNIKWFSDAKTTGYNFNQPIILSTGKLSFIDGNKENYLIHRIYSIKDEPKFRICNNIFRISDIFLPNLEIFNNSLRDSGLSIRNLNLAVPTASELIQFGDIIELNANA